MEKLIGQTFGFWTITAIATGAKRKSFVCRCVCDAEKVVPHSNITAGKSKSCGCKMASFVAESKVKHGKHGTPIYRRWADMNDRCSRASHISYPNYGGRGIKVCDRWLDFSNFYEDMGDVPDGMTLDRIDPDGNYEKSNCRWATMTEQQNNKRSNRVLEHGGVKKTVAEWGRTLDIKASTIHARLANGWTVEDALTKEVLERPTLTFQGRTQTVGEWSQELGFERNVVSSRLKAGWTDEEALSIPSFKDCPIDLRRPVPPERRERARDETTGRFVA